MDIKIVEKLNKAIDDFNNSNFESATKRLNQVLNHQPNNFDALQIIAVINGVQGKHEKASEYLKKALQIKPNNSFIHFNLAKSLSELGKELEALPHHIKAIELAPENEDALLNYGITLINIGKNNDALECFNKILEKNNTSVPALVNKANALKKLDKKEEALEILMNALRINPNNSITNNNIGTILHSMQKYEESLIYYQKAININNEYSETYNNMGSALSELIKYNEAIDCFKKAIEINKDYVEAWSNLGTAQSELGNYSDCLDSYKKSIEINPNYAEAVCNLGTALYEKGDYLEAINQYKKAILIDRNYAESHYNLANLCLSRFDFNEGWKEYKWRFFIKKTQSSALLTTRPEWNGVNSNARLLIWAEQGIGDQILYCSMLPSLANYKNKITISLDKKLIKIFNKSFPNFTFIEKGEALEEEEYDEQISMGGLGIFFRKSVHDFPRENIFLKFDNINNVREYKQKLSSGRICGISWRSNNKYIGFHKSMPLKIMEPILQNKNFNFINLQYGTEKEEYNIIKKNNINCFDELDIYNSLEDLMLLISICDVVVTTSNTTAHVAGAMGKKTILLIPNSKGKLWYWNGFDDSCLWYPTIKIVQQDYQGDWKSTINKVNKILEKI